jgi:hypothetical protein
MRRYYRGRRRNYNLSVERLRELLSYDPCSGLFFWRTGGLAGNVNDRGYRYIQVEGRMYRANRLAWFYAYGKWPNVLDHFDENKSNNSIWNLIDGTHLDNARRYHARRRPDRAVSLLRNFPGPIGVRK